MPEQMKLVLMNPEAVHRNRHLSDSVKTAEYGEYREEKQMDNTRTLCGANSYVQKYYFNHDDFGNLPEHVKQELQILCVMFTEENGGIITLTFDEDGTLKFNVTRDDADVLFDDIGSELAIRKIQKEKEELLNNLELYYKMFFLKGSM